MKSWALIANQLGSKASRSSASHKLTIPGLFFCAFACLLSLPATAADAHTSLRVTIRIDPVVLIVVADSSGAPIKAWGTTSATASLPISYGKSSTTVNIDASGQPNDSGCTILARLSTATPASVTVNSKTLSTTNTVVTDAPAYPSSAALAIEATAAQQSTALPAILLTCQPK